MKTNKQQVTKPASKDPVKEAIGHPDGPGLEEMLAGQEEKKLGKKNYKGKKSPDIPII
ncbi:MAG TPA: hypothetical protein VG367_20335 [Mucilaginibacter sp.]|jgi:hypothetical protein|nr:hypothetical protein [Mucilaginibacter sp.]